jgi:hypothetical protein
LTSYANNLLQELLRQSLLPEAKIRANKEELPRERLEDSRMEESFEDLIDRDGIKDFVSSSAQCFLHHARR